MPESLEVLPVPGIGEITPGTDLAAVIAAAAPWLCDGDILVVTSKIVSKSEGRLVDVPESGPAREAARAAILAHETARAVARRGSTHIVQTHHGFVMASAGIDASNVDRSRLVLLPADPDASARSLRRGLTERLGVDVAVIVSDTMGRPWRNGLTDVALGAAGIEAIRDHRGEIDPYGNELHITQMAVVDELAAAAELVKGKCDQVPVAVVRGLLPGVRHDARRPDGPGAAVLVRDAAHDLFALGTAEAHAAGLHAASTLTDVDAVMIEPDGVAGVVAEVLAALSTAVAPTSVIALDPVVSDDVDGVGAVIGFRLGTPHPADTSTALLRLGTDLHRVRCALSAEGLATTWITPIGDTWLALLAVGRS
jgi:coenzyme F420-0:L-glutamate ligase/coenzyme F420-1:gamma-L-glutamate ligase